MNDDIDINEEEKDKGISITAKQGVFIGFMTIFLSAMMVALTSIPELDINSIKLSVTLIILYAGSLVVRYDWEWLSGETLNKVSKVLGFLSILSTIITLWR